VHKFDPSRLNLLEQIAWMKQLERTGDAGARAIFATIVRGVNMLRAEGKRPEEITAAIIGEYCDAEESKRQSAIRRFQAARLARAMVRQALNRLPQERHLE
jgi:hypothetical protein